MDFIDMLSIFLPVIAFICVLIILSINLYTTIRPNGFITVNCWFCNQWCKVSRKFQNSWDCPFCEQYNGFTKDGDYNKPIPEQHDELMNKVLPASTVSNSTIPDNGLCSTCKNNQQLKVQQLAMFSPIDEYNYDEEVERYEKQLERAYRLCPQCEITVKRTLHKQKSILLELRLSTLRKYGLNFLDLNKSSSGISKIAKRGLFLTAIRYTTIALAVVRLFEVLKMCDFSHKNITNALPGTVVPYALLFRDITFLLYNCISSLFETVQYLQGIVLQNCISLITHYLDFKLNEAVTSVNFILNVFKYNPSNVLLFVGFFLQSVFLIFNRNKLLDFIKCAAWIALLFNNVGLLNLSFMQENLSPKVVEIALCCFVILCPSSTHKTTKIQKSFIKKKRIISCENEFSDEEIDCDNNVELLNSTFKSQSSEKLNTSMESNKSNNLFNISPTSTLKLFNITNKKTDDLTHAFGKQPIFGNPLNTPCFNFSTCYRSDGSSNESISTRKSCINDSLNSSYYADKSNESISLPLKENSPNKSSEQEWYKGLSDLHLSTYPNTKKLNGDELPAAFRVSSPLLSRPKPVLSPPRLRNVTQSSWVAGGYWKSNDFLNNTGSFSNLSRSSSQSSGFGSQASSQQPNNFDSGNVFNSLPSSRTTSVCGEYDRYSVFSEPVYYNHSPPNVYPQSRFYPTLRPDQQLYICPKPLNGVNQQRLSKSPTNVLNDGLFCANNTKFAYPVFNSQRPSSRESNFTQNVLNSSASSCALYNPSSNLNSFSSLNLNNPFYSHTTAFGVKNTRPLSVINSSNSTFSQPYEKGSLLKKWRDQNATELEH